MASDRLIVSFPSYAFADISCPVPTLCRWHHGFFSELLERRRAYGSIFGVQPGSHRRLWRHVPVIYPGRPVTGVGTRCYIVRSAAGRFEASSYQCCLRSEGEDSFLWREFHLMTAPGYQGVGQINLLLLSPPSPSVHIVFTGIDSIRHHIIHHHGSPRSAVRGRASPQISHNIA